MENGPTTDNGCGAAVMMEDNAHFETVGQGPRRNDPDALGAVKAGLDGFAS